MDAHKSWQLRKLEGLLGQGGDLQADTCYFCRGECKRANVTHCPDLNLQPFARDTILERRKR